MQIVITGHNVEVTDALREYVTTKLDKLDRFFDKINHIHVILNVEKLQQVAEATLQVNAGDIHAKADSDNMYSAIDALTDKLVRQLNKHKEKLNSH
ncbi:ribosome hibernation promoting factor [Photobacterium damselae subsp. piscicida]|nr:ribosome hibernation promoting factor [Photobacterium damselae subsp. piscicida]MDP2557450.1 ribosome hibernation promoting factor [Photobacterium damselae subsp. piscicida]